MVAYRTKGERYKHFALSLEELLDFYCNTELSESSDLATSWQNISEIVTNRASSNTIYTIEGVKIATSKEKSLPKGLYIINGKKVMVK